MKKLLLVILIAVVQIAIAGSKLSPDLENSPGMNTPNSGGTKITTTPNSGGTNNIDVIVQFTHPPTKDDLKLLGPYGQMKKQLDIVHGVHVSLSPSDIDRKSTRLNSSH